MTELRIETLVLPGSPIGEENPLPVFRDKETNRSVSLHQSIPEAKRSYFGWQAGQRVLPYRMQDNYNRKRAPYEMKVAVLENETLKATFWIELGGRLMSLVYKPLNRELLYNNPVFQPANLAIRNAWFAGGVEWNAGHYGHSFLTCSPIFAAAIRGAQGEPGLRLYEFERCKGILWHTDFYLPPQSEFLTAFTRVVNPQEEDSSMYWWTNIAVPEEPGVRVLAPTDETIYIDSELKGFGYAKIGNLPSLPGKDPTYSLNWPNANEFFFQCDHADIPWEAALDKHGAGLIEASTPRLKYRKLFCWGTHQGGRHWQEFLAEPGMAYLEIQAGLAPTQLHHLPFAAGESWHWTEFFGYLQAEPAQVHDPNYNAAWRSVDQVLKQRITADDMEAVEQRCLALAQNSPDEILQQGAGWGALEIERFARTGKPDKFPPACNFPATSMGREQDKWLPLLDGQALPEQRPEETPGAWMVQNPWRELLERSLESPDGRNWYALLHWGVMQAEIFNDEAAESAWKESLEKQPSTWAHRNLAAIYRTSGQIDRAEQAYADAWQAALDCELVIEALAYEYLSVLVEAQKYQQAQVLFDQIPPQASASDRIQILRAVIALKLNQLEMVESILGREFATVREGQVDLSNLWLELWQRRTSLKTGRPLDEISLEEVEGAHPVPPGIDFRSVD
jgi:hypothetical protein